ncbi:MAG: winged helix-turn-helix domain-containing protein [Acidobacteria bacterium]|nr:winged helix-turn-helix domain-containing protein [Acidobacteriota bacterium]
MSEGLKEVYEFEDFRVDVRRRLVTRGGRGVPLTPKAFETLLALLRSGGSLLTKDALISEVWPDTFVEEGNLAQNIFLLRRALGEAKGEHRFIVTVPGAGYLFVPRVRASDASTPARAEDRAVGSLAVLPFKSLAAEGADSDFGLALADALTRGLSTWRGVKVLPTDAALRLRESTPEAQAAAVEALLHGLYQRDGARLRVSVQLARTCDGATAWAAKFDEQSDDPFALQDSIAERVARALAPKLSGHERRHLSVVRDVRGGRLRRSS